MPAEKAIEELPERAILLEDYNAFSQSAHAARLHWVSPKHGDFKPVVIHGRRVIPSNDVDYS